MKLSQNYNVQYENQYGIVQTVNSNETQIMCFNVTVI